MKEVCESESVTTCPSCQGSIDVSGIQVGAEIACPLCNHEFTLTRMFGNFLLERQIGQGGMGAVYLGKDTILKRKVAIKLLRTELVEDEKFISTFLFEAQITASLNHPNIVQVYAFGEQRGTYYLVMEHIPGGSLDDKILNDGSVSEEEGLKIGIAIASGLNFAHHRGLIHRDIKPGNILFGEDGTPKVVDFGLSLAYDSEDHFAGEIWGTPYYVAPEKLERKPEDWRSDLYSLGTTLFHAMTGRPPYQGADPNEVAMKHLSGNIVSIRAFVPTISNQTAHAIGKSIARFPEDRSGSYEEFITQLEDAKRRLHSKDEKETVKVAILPSKEEETRRSAWLVMVMVGVSVIAAIMFLFFRDAIFKDNKKQPAFGNMTTSEGVKPIVRTDKQEEKKADEEEKDNSTVGGSVPSNPGLLAAGTESRSRPGNVVGSIIGGPFVVTWDGTSQEQDWYAVTLSVPTTINQVVFNHGKCFGDGGWFDASAGKPQVQVQTSQNSPWTTVGALSTYPATTATDGANLADGTAFTCQLSQSYLVWGVRVIGKPASGTNPQQMFSSCGGLAAFLTATAQTVPVEVKGFYGLVTGKLLSTTAQGFTFRVENIEPWRESTAQSPQTVKGKEIFIAFHRQGAGPEVNPVQRTFILQQIGKSQSFPVAITDQDGTFNILALSRSQLGLDSGSGEFYFAEPAPHPVAYYSKEQQTVVCENGMLRVRPSKYGIIWFDIYHSKDGRWYLQKNNLNLMTMVGQTWNNTEGDIIVPRVEILSETANEVSLRYHYSCPNGSKFYMDLSLKAGEPEVTFKVYAKPDTQNIAGFQWHITNGQSEAVARLEFDTYKLSAKSFPLPLPGGRLTLQKMERYYRLQNLVFKFSGDETSQPDPNNPDWMERVLGVEQKVIWGPHMRDPDNLLSNCGTSLGSAPGRFPESSLGLKVYILSGFPFLKATR